MIGTNRFTYQDGLTDDIIQKVSKLFWITEAGAQCTDSSFENFMQRIKNNSIDFDTTTLSLIYHSNGNQYKMLYNDYFSINGTIENSDYARFDSPYIKAQRKPDSLQFNCSGKSLFLDFEKMIRRF